MNLIITFILLSIIVTQGVFAKKIFVTIEDENGSVLRKTIEIDTGEIESIPLDALGIDKELNVKLPKETTSFKEKIKNFGILPHGKNYILPYTHSFNDRGAGELRDEAQFQLSFKKLLAEDIFGLDLYMSYTQKSFWQIYHGSDSRPFRESNYMPEIYLQKNTSIPVSVFVLDMYRFGYVHESNGGDIYKSRSWDRFFAEAKLHNGNLMFRPKIWLRIPESKKANPLDSDGDDNPDIHKYLGYGELGVRYTLNQHALELTLRNNLDFSQNRGSMLLEYFYPLEDGVNFYLRYFTGYGESLIDYDKSVDKVGIGFLLNID